MWRLAGAHTPQDLRPALTVIYSLLLWQIPLLTRKEKGP